MSHWAANYAGLLVDNCAQGMLLTDSAYHITQANTRAATILGASHSGELIGKSLHTDDSPEGICLGQPYRMEEGEAVGNGEGPRSGRYSITTEFGAELPVELQFLATDGAVEGPGGYLVLVTDLSEHVDLERAVLQTEKLAALDNIVAGIAHELNNPMTAILGYAELLLATEKDPKRKQRVALIAEEADRCGKIITNMLTFTRSYGKTLEKASINLLLDEVLSLQAYQMRVDNINIHTFLDGNLPDSQLQPAAMRRLFLNLIHNAHQALMAKAGPKRNFWATTELRGNSIFIQIADDGPGIPKDIRHKIFDPFFTTRPFGEGMGLGLSVSYGIVHEHRGRIWMEPRAGGGTDMNIEFPMNRGGN